MQAGKKQKYSLIFIVFLIFVVSFNIEVCIWSKCTIIVCAAVCAEMVEMKLPM